MLFPIDEEAIYEAVLVPMQFLLEPNKRLYFGYILSALILATWVYHRHIWRSRNSLSQSPFLAGLLRFIFPKAIWLNRSSAIDFGLLFLNATLKALLFIPLIISAFSVGFYTVKLLTLVFGPLELSGTETSTVSQSFLILSYSLSLTLALDASRYLLHRLMHQIPWLWQFHKWHHSARTMTPLTLYRIHPVESALQYTRDVLVTGVVTGCFFYCSGQNIDLATIMGVNAARFAFNLFGANLRHSHIWLSFGPLERIFISPAQHQIHHSSAPEHHNLNFGSQLSIWDRMGGTLYRTDQYERLNFGLKRPQDPTI